MQQWQGIKLTEFISLQERNMKIFSNGTTLEIMIPPIFGKDCLSNRNTNILISEFRYKVSQSTM